MDAIKYPLSNTAREINKELNEFRISLDPKIKQNAVLTTIPMFAIITCTTPSNQKLKESSQRLQHSLYTGHWISVVLSAGYP